MNDFDIRFSVEQDFASLEGWFSDPSVSDDYPFTFDEREATLKNWIGFSKYNASLTGLIGDQPIAIGTLFLMPYKKVSHHCSFYLIVDPDHRRKGVGTSMVRNLLHLAKTRFRLESVHVEIYEPSHLQPLLLKLGFEAFARQEGFVKLGDCLRARVLMEHCFV